DLVIHSNETKEEKTFSTSAEIRSVNLPLWLRNGTGVLQGAQDLQGRLLFYRADVKTGEFREILKTELTDSVSVALSQDEKSVYVSIRDGSRRFLSVVDLATRETKRVFPFDALAASAVSFAMSPDGRTLAIKRLIPGASPVEARLSSVGIDGAGFHD